MLCLSVRSGIRLCPLVVSSLTGGRHRAVQTAAMAAATLAGLGRRTVRGVVFDMDGKNHPDGWLTNVKSKTKLDLAAILVVQQCQQPVSCVRYFAHVTALHRL